MKASEILQGLAELLAGIEAGGGQAAMLGQQQPANQSAELTQVQVSNTGNDADVDTSGDAGTFVPPLQAKIELLKKATGVASTYDENGEQDELARMKQMAGIQQPHPVVQDMAGEDEPLDA